MSEEKKAPSYFYFLLDYFDHFDKLTNEQVSTIMRYIGDYTRGGIETKMPEDAASSVVLSVMLKDIDRAFKKYHAQCENGKKGGAPKGNRNAAKKKAKQETAAEPEEEAEIELDETGHGVALVILQMQQENYGALFDIHKTLIAASYYMIGCNSSDGLLDDYETLDEASEHETPPSLCTMILKNARERYAEQQHDKTFDEVFGKVRDKSKMLFRLSPDELRDYIKRCEEQGV